MHDLGPWRLGVKPSRIPCHPAAVDYFAQAVVGALARMTGAGFHPDNIAGPLLLEAVDHRHSAAGYYERDTDLAVVTARHEPKTDYGADLGAVYGEDPAAGMLAWACCHETSHRVWYRRLTDSGRAFWERVHEALTAGVSRSRCVGMARRVGAGPGLAELAAVSHGEVLRATAELDPLDRLLGTLLYQAYGGRDPLGYFRWLWSGGHRDGLASGYAEKHAKESWAEAVASVAMEDGDRSPDREQTEMGFRVVRATALAALWVGVRPKATAP